MITREQYMNKQATHQEYYAQFVTAHMREAVSRRFGNTLKTAGEHFNGIPLHGWDNLGLGFRDVIRRKAKELGDCFSASTVVCALKEAARQVVENKS